MTTKTKTTKTPKKTTATVDWSEAGRKSWVTRRLNEAARKRSDASRKAAATRRANQGY